MRKSTWIILAARIVAMRKAIIQVGLCIFACTAGSATALADGVSYTLTGTYGASELTTPLTAPNTSFQLAFTEPLPLVVTASSLSDFTTNVTVTYTTGSTSFTGPANVTFVVANLGGFFTTFTTGGFTYTFQTEGQQLFSGTTSSPTLIPGAFPVSVGLIDINNIGTMNFGSGNIVATAVSTAVPEPTSLLLLGTGLFGLFGLGRRRLSC